MSRRSSKTDEPRTQPSSTTEWSGDAAFRGGDPIASTRDEMPYGNVPHVGWAVGRTLGDYVILDQLGAGGMGIVYRAHQKSARRMVVLKVIRAEWWGDSTEGEGRRAEAQFRNEAEALAQLEHDHIVPIHDVGRVEGVVYFSMRLIQGRSLARMLREDGPMEPRRAAAYIEPIARAIQYAHERGIVHRDLKPSNVMVNAEDRPYQIGQGLCKSVETTDATSMAGRPMGTAEFMAPEQARGDRQVGNSVDIYGLGATLMALLTGRPPFGYGPAAAVLRRVIHDEPRWPYHRDRAVPRELKAICFKCIEKDPSQRIESAADDHFHRATWALNAAVWDSRFVAISTPPPALWYGLTGGPAFGVHYTSVGRPLWAGSGCFPGGSAGDRRPRPSSHLVLDVRFVSS
ncbi:MAG: serine/threonine-protein kinase [Isosphaeraceae bacterium]